MSRSPGNGSRRPIPLDAALRRLEAVLEGLPRSWIDPRLALAPRPQRLRDLAAESVCETSFAFGIPLERVIEAIRWPPGVSYRRGIRALPLASGLRVYLGHDREWGRGVADGDLWLLGAAEPGPGEHPDRVLLRSLLSPHRARRPAPWRPPPEEVHLGDALDDALVESFFGRGGRLRRLKLRSTG